MDGFRRHFGTAPKAVGEAHGRVNLIGDHTDYNDGLVLPTAIPQKTVVEVGDGDGTDEAYSAAIGKGMAIDRRTPLQSFARYVGGCICVLEEAGHAVPPLRIHVDSTVPIGAGLSSSAALEVATLRAIDTLLGLALPAVDIARLGQKAEILHAGVACGIMDQMACSLAETDRMLYLDTRSLAYRLLRLPRGAALLVIDSGVPRGLAGTAYNERRRECAEAARVLGVSTLREVDDPADLAGLPPPLLQRARHVVTENQRVREAVEAEASEFGALMNASHASLRDDYQVTVPAVDDLVATLQQVPGIFGARMTGAGFGGASVALIDDGSMPAILDRVVGLSVGQGWRIVVPPVA